MVNALTPPIYAKCRALEAPAYDEQIIAHLGGRSPAATRNMVSDAVRKVAKKRAAEEIGGF
jgi:hypothetical protein